MSGYFALGSLTLVARRYSAVLIAGIASTPASHRGSALSCAYVKFTVSQILLPSAEYSPREWKLHLPTGSACLTGALERNLVNRVIVIRGVHFTCA